MALNMPHSPGTVPFGTITPTDPESPSTSIIRPNAGSPFTLRKNQPTIAPDSPFASILRRISGNSTTWKVEAEVKPFRLFELPREIRDLVYAYHFAFMHDRLKAHDVFVEFGGSPVKNTKPPSFLPALCRASPQLYREATPAFMKSSCLMLSDRSSAVLMYSWLRTFAKGTESVRALNVSLTGSRHDYYDTAGTVEKHWKLILQCSGLTHLTIRIVTDPLASPRTRGSGGTVNSKYGAQLEILRLENLLELKRLRSLAFSTSVEWGWLKRWLEEVFRKRRPEVGVEVFDRSRRWDD